MVCFSLAGFIPQRVGVPRISKGDFSGIFRLIIFDRMIISEILAGIQNFGCLSYRVSFTNLGRSSGE